MSGPGPMGILGVKSADFHILGGGDRCGVVGVGLPDWSAGAVADASLSANYPRYPKIINQTPKPTTYCLGVSSIKSQGFTKKNPASIVWVLV